jgi:sn-glycerol 3-phosphate transport system substrate-binding protein
MFDNFSDRQKEAAWESIKFATSPEEAALFSVATGYVPTRYAAVESEVIKELWAEHPQYEVAFNQLEFARDTWGSPYWWEFNSMVNKVVSRLIQDRSITPQQAVDQIAEEASWLFPGNM